MKELKTRGRATRHVRKPSLPRTAASLLLLFSFTLSSARAQTPTPQTDGGQDKRGLVVKPDSKPTPTPAPQQAQPRGARPELVLQTGYPYIGPTYMVFSPDGRLLATTIMNSSQIKLWDVSTGRELRTLDASSGASADLLGMMSGVSAIAFSRDGRLIASGNKDGTVNVWEVVTGGALPAIAPPPPPPTDPAAVGTTTASYKEGDNVTAVVFSPDARTLVAFRGRGLEEARQYDVTTGREMKKLDLKLVGDSGISSGHPVVTPDGAQLVIFAADVSSGKTKEIAEFVDLATGEVARTLMLPQGFELTSKRMTADGRMLSASLGYKDVKAASGPIQLKLWDLTANSQERVLTELPPGKGGQIEFSPDGRAIALAVGNTVKVWDTATGQEARTFDVPHRPDKPASDPYRAIMALALSSDGHTLATSDSDAQLLLWSTDTGALVRSLRGGANAALSASFSSDGTRLYTGSKTVWDVATGRGLRAASVSSDPLYSMLSPDGRLLAVRDKSDSEIKLFDAKTQRQLQTLAPATTEKAMTSYMAFSPDGRLLASNYWATPNANTASYSRDDIMRAAKEASKAAKNNPADFQRIYMEALTKQKVDDSGIQTQVKIWDTQTGREMRTITVPLAMPFYPSSTSRLYFSPDGRELAATTTSSDKLMVWDVATGQQLRTIADAGAPQQLYGVDTAQLQNRFVTIAFSPDGRTLATGGSGYDTTAFDPSALMAAAQTQALARAGGNPKKAEHTPGQLQMLLEPMIRSMMNNARPVGVLKLWDAATGKEVHALKGVNAAVVALAFSADGHTLAAASADDTLKLWDVETGAEIRTLKGQDSMVGSLAFSPDGHLLASIGSDGTTYLWDVKTGEHLATLISVGDGGDWLAVTPDGLFDGSPAAWNEILWRFSKNTFDVAPVETFFNEFFYPGLLSDIAAGKRPVAPRDISLIDRRQPVVALTTSAPQSGSVTTRTINVSVQVKDAPAGAKDVRLFRNGSLVRVWHGDVLKGQQGATLEATIPVIAGENRLTAYAFNRDNVKSTDAELDITGADALKRAGTAYVIAVGVNSYENAQYNLRYASADAQDFAEEVRRQQTRLGKYDHVEVVPLMDADATKANILAALKILAGATEPLPANAPKPLAQLKRAEPEDTVVVYFAGHGTAQGNRFYLIPHDLGYAGERDALDAAGLKAILAHSISDEELQLAVEGLDAGQLLLVIDACNSGQALEAEEKRRGPMNSKGLAQLAYEKGMYVLTAAQSYQAALEAAQLGHGLLTYALVEEGLKAMAADDEPKDGVLQAREWLDFATERVPQMQTEKMKQARALNVNLSFAEGADSRASDPEARSVQRPRAFYRRELESNPLVLAKKQ